jgi:hypothetical protein
MLQPTHIKQPRYSDNRYQNAQIQDIQNTDITIHRAKILKIHSSNCTGPSCNTGITPHRAKILKLQELLSTEPEIISFLKHSPCQQIFSDKLDHNRKSVWCILVFAEVTVSQIFKKSRRFITVFTKATDWTSF